MDLVRERFRHVEVFEIGFADFLAQCEEAPVVRVYGRAQARTHTVGMLKRFNRAVFVDVGSATGSTVVAYRLKRDRKTGEWVVQEESFLLTWHELRYVTWMTEAGYDPNGFWLKVTIRDSLGAVCPHCGQLANAHYRADLRIVA